jgi:hypothetical protein
MKGHRGFGRWHPTPQQISLAIDCAAAKLPLEKAAGIVGIAPRTLWGFTRRIDLPGIFGTWRDRPRHKAISAGPAGSVAPQTAVPAMAGSNLSRRQACEPWLFCQP